MSTETLPLALRLPLQGASLIEASAGTGKTWTIAAMYLRLVLGHGAAQSDDRSNEAQGLAYPRPLTPGEILVVTFTRAATQELVGRIRERLSQAAQFFREEEDQQHATDGAADPFLRQLRDAYPRGAAREEAAWRLASAAAVMDEASIHTIDAWCRRVLHNYASLTGSLGDDGLDGDTDALWKLAAMDFWRNHIYPLDAAATEAVQQFWRDAQAWLNKSVQLRKERRTQLEDGVSTMAPDPAADPIPPLLSPAKFGAWLAQALAHQQRTLEKLAQGWDKKADRLEGWMDEQRARNDHWKSASVSRFPEWLGHVRAWAANPTPRIADLSDTGQRRLTPEGLLEVRKSSAPPMSAADLPPEFAEFERLLKQLQKLPPLDAVVSDYALRHTYQRWQRLKAEQSLMDFSDLLLRVRHALAGPHGATLRQRLRQQYPVVMIDEFQDTSTRQHEVFDTIYRAPAQAENIGQESSENPNPENPNPEADTPTALLLIGDAKQSIYAFRGADIEGFLAAKASTGGHHNGRHNGRHYALETNFRSTHAVVDAVNHFFAHGERKKTTGAFHYKQAGANPLPFTPVQANGLTQQLQTADGQALPALTFCAAAPNQRDSRALYAQLCAEQIVQWLNQPLRFHNPQAAGDATNPGAALQPGDIAILVHRAADARLIQQALHQRGLGGVYLSDRQSVFDSPESRDLVHWLQAVAEPANVALARAAYATALIAQPLPELLASADEEQRFDAQLNLLQTLHSVWRRQGVLPMLRQTIHHLGLAARWQALGDGRTERRMTNLLHLAELLQQASGQHEGEQGLIRYLAQQIQLPREASGNSEIDTNEQTVRLESDAQLIQIVTIHKSKGLEYPVVMLPFASHRGKTRQNTPAHSDPYTEQLREELRLLYVALTRARHALWVGVPRHKSDTKSALAHLVAGELRSRYGNDTKSQWLAPLQTMAKGCAHIHISAATRPATTRYQPLQSAPALRAPQAYPGGIERHFAIASFSGLVRGMQTAPARPDSHTSSKPLLPMRSEAHVPAPARELADMDAQAFLWQPYARLADDEAQPQRADPASETAEAAPHIPAWHSLPGSARLGDWLHQSLEWLHTEGFPAQPSPTHRQRLARTATLAGFEEHSANLQQWMARILATALPLPAQAEHPRLGQIDHTLPEMEFWLPVQYSAAHRDHSHRGHHGDRGHLADAAALDALCRAHILPGQDRPTLHARQWQGMLMGFADLVFEHQGRFWVLDYKTNRLGQDASAYHPQALQDALLHHRYDLQAALYLYALHRLLRVRLPHYRPEQHLGGALYWFVRGIDHPGAGLLSIATGHSDQQALLHAMDAIFGIAAEV